MLQTEGAAGEDQEQQRPLVQSRKRKVCVWSREVAEWEGKGGLAGPCKGFQAPPKSKRKPPKDLSKGFLFSVCKALFQMKLNRKGRKLKLIEGLFCASQLLIYHSTVSKCNTWHRGAQ